MTRLLLLCLLLTIVNAFVPLSVVRHQSSALGVSALAPMLEDELSYRYVLAKAKECAFSDTSTSEEASSFLNRILEIESGCVAGTLTGHELCDNVGEMADLVAHLRQRVDEGPSMFT